MKPRPFHFPAVEGLQPRKYFERKSKIARNMKRQYLYATFAFNLHPLLPTCCFPLSRSMGSSYGLVLPKSDYAIFASRWGFGCTGGVCIDIDAA